VRILKIRSWKHFGLWCLDQGLHGAIVLAATLPAIWMPDWRGILLGGSLVLLVREFEQARDTIEAWIQRRKARETAKPTVVELLQNLHLPDRVGDIVFGTLIAVGLWIGGSALCGSLVQSIR